MTSTTPRTDTYLDRAVDELRHAAEEHADAGQGLTLDADALHEAIRTATDMRARLAAEPVLDGATRMLPVGSLQYGDVLVDEAGASIGTVAAVTRRLDSVDVHLADGTTHAHDRAEHVEVAA